MTETVPMQTPRKLVLGAIGLMTVSQFLHYQGAYNQPVGVAIGGGGGGDHAVPNLDNGYAVANAYDHINGVSGWSLHHHAWILLIALSVLFALDIKLGKAWDTWGYWAAVAGLFCCLFPTDFTLSPAGTGFYVGLIAVALTAWAAHEHGKSLKSSSVETAP